MSRKLIIGCGHDWEHASYHDDYGCHPKDLKDLMKFERKLHPKGIHPSEEYDTLDSDDKIKPTFLADINNCKHIAEEFKHSSYELVLTERVPANLFQPGSSASFGHLLKEDGMLGLIQSGFLLIHFFDIW